MNEAELELLSTWGLSLDESTFSGDDDSLQALVLIGAQNDNPPLTVNGLGFVARVDVRPGLSDDLRSMIARWCLEHLPRFFGDGPELDGWQRRSDGDWQLWLRVHELPDMTFLDGQ